MEIEQWEFPASRHKTAGSVGLPQMPATFSGANQNQMSVDWNITRNEVNKNPNGIANWDKLLKLTDAAAKSFTNKDLAKNIVHETYTEFLTKFPLYFQYWRMYIAIVKLLETDKRKILEVFELSVEKYPNSLELWCDYLDFLMEFYSASKDEDVATLRQSFQTAQEKVGLQFLSHPFWDKYIAFETGLTSRADTNVYEQNQRILALYLTLLKIPLHQYGRYFKAFTKFRNEVGQDFMKNEDKDLAEYLKSSEPSKSEEATITQYYSSTMFSKTGKAVMARWKYESKFKPSYFNLKHLPVESLQNFEAYLDFEEKNGSKDQIICLYERVLVPCAFYEKFWLKYLKWLTFDKNHDRGLAKNVYDRAINVFVPLNKNILRMAYLHYLELEKEYQTLNSVYILYLQEFKSDPKLLSQILTKFFNYTKRQNASAFLNNCETLIAKYFKEETEQHDQLPANLLIFYEILDDTLICYLINEVIKTRWLVNLEPESSIRAIFSKYSKYDELKNDYQFWVSYFNFEKTCFNYPNLLQVINHVKVYTHLSPQFIEDLTNLFIDFAQANASQIAIKYEIELKLIYKEIMKQKLDIESSIAFQHSMKLRTSSDIKKTEASENKVHKNLVKMNGNSGVTVEESPIIANQLPIYTTLQKVPPLPSFRNVEKAHAPFNFPSWAQEYVCE